jgi:hypothetical protein
MGGAAVGAARGAHARWLANSRGRLLEEPDGAIWVQHFQVMGSPVHSDWWTRFDASGRLVGTIQIPPDRDVVRFRDGRVILSGRAPEQRWRRLFVHAIDPVPH